MSGHNGTIRILGAGISGLSAATLLAKEGYPVKVYEKEDHIGGRQEKNLCALRNYKGEDTLKEVDGLGLELTPTHEIDNVVKVSPNAEHRIEGRGLYYVVARGRDPESIENQLYSLAKDAGAEFVFGNMDVVYPDIDIVSVGSTWVRRNIYAAGHRYLHANVESKTMYLFYDNNVSPQGYLCLIPDGESTLALSVSFDARKFTLLRPQLDKLLQENQRIKELLSGGTLEEAVDGYGYYSKNPIEHSIDDGKLFVGEAAGFLDASRGFGVRYAIITGALAARSIIDGSDYASLLRERFGNEFDKNLRKRAALDGLSNDDYDQILRGLGEKKSITEYLNNGW